VDRSTIPSTASVCVAVAVGLLVTKDVIITRALCRMALHETSKRRPNKRLQAPAGAFSFGRRASIGMQCQCAAAPEPRR
jgi:hypothetical protein